MRRLVAVVLFPLAVSAALLTTGCTSAQPSGPPPASASPTPERDPAVTRACDGARKVINEATSSFTAELATAVAAGDQGDTTAQLASMDKLRTIFKDWATRLRDEANRAADPEVKAVLLEYAGAVDATIARVQTPEDLSRLETFDDGELDTTASRLAAVCG